MEASDRSGLGTAGRGGQLRGVPETVRRAALRLLALSGRRGVSHRRRWRWRRLGRGRRAVRRGPVLPAGCRGRGRGVHAPEAAGLPAVPGHGRRTGGRGRRRGRSPPPPHSAAAADGPPAVLRRRPPSGRDAAHAGPQPHSRTAPVVARLAQVDGGQPARFRGRGGRQVQLVERGRLSCAAAAAAAAAGTRSPTK